MNKDVFNFQKDAESGLRLVADTIGPIESDEVEKQFVSFMFLRVSSEWRRLDAETKTRHKAEFVDIVESYQRRLLVYSYSLVGFDAKADLMLWRIGTSLDMLQDMTADLYKTGLGSYIEPSDNFLSMTKKVMFVDAPSDDRRQVQAGSANYHFVYPCAKQDAWYGLSTAERDRLVEENYMVGKRFSNIKIHLTHSFGSSEHEYLISFETDEPKDFLALTEELRESPVSKYAVRGMPFYTCRRRDMGDCIDALG